MLTGTLRICCGLLGSIFVEARTISGCGAHRKSGWERREIAIVDGVHLHRHSCRPYGRVSVDNYLAKGTVWVSEHYIESGSQG